MPGGGHKEKHLYDKVGLHLDPTLGVDAIDSVSTDGARCPHEVYQMFSRIAVGHVLASFGDD